MSTAAATALPSVALVRPAAGSGFDGRALQSAAVRLGERIAGKARARAARSSSFEERERLFERVVASEKERVFRVALSVLGPGRESEAEDVAQEAFVRAFRALPGFRGESRLSTWLYRLAFNLAVDHRRAAGRRPATAGDEATAALPARDPASDPYRTSQGAERRRAVRDALDALPEDQRAVLHLHYWLGHTVREIAELLGLPAGTVKSHLHRGRERLGKELADHAE